MFKPKDRYSPRSKQPRGIRDRYTALGDPAGMGSAPQSKIAHGFISASSLARVSPRPIAPKFRSIGTSAMPIRSRQPTTNNQELPLQPCSFHPSSPAVLFSPLCFLCRSRSHEHRPTDCFAAGYSAPPVARRCGKNLQSLSPLKPQSFRPFRHLG